MDMNMYDLPIEAAIRSFIASNLLYSEDGFGYSDEASLLRERIIDSLGVVELAAFLGQRFGVRVEQSEVRPENFDSVARLSAFVRRKQAVVRPAAAQPV
ncbi:MAG: acyl carrier protein [Elusimicrobia bacterium]|nr:acyl carrier protein [Elusimicrobiota bacterium]